MPSPSPGNAAQCTPSAPPLTKTEGASFDITQRIEAPLARDHHRRGKAGCHQSLRGARPFTRKPLPCAEPREAARECAQAAAAQVGTEQPSIPMRLWSNAIPQVSEMILAIEALQRMLGPRITARIEAEMDARREHAGMLAGAIVVDCLRAAPDAHQLA